MVDLAISVAHNALFIDLPLTIFFSGALVVVLLTFQSKSVLYDVCRFERHAWASVDWCFDILKTAQS